MPNTTNIIGNPVDPEVMAQLKVRAEYNGVHPNQSIDEILFKARKNAFVKLTSFVEVTDSALEKELGYTGTNLAKEWTLFNGVYAGNGKVENKYNISGYGQGGVGELGLRPMPGITDILVEPIGQQGAIRKAKISFECHNLNQLNIIDVLYFRLGFSMLLEWGHATYINNKKELQIAEFPIEVFSNDWDKEALYREIEKRRKRTNGNYDAMIGIVVNYQWNLQTNGSYKCTLDIISPGAILESLKINGTEAIPALSFQNDPAKGTSSQTSPAQTNPNNVGSALAATLRLWKSNCRKPANEFYEYVGYAFKSGLNLWRNPTDAFKKGYNAGYMSSGHSAPDIDQQALGNIFVPELKIVGDDKAVNAYIPLGLLLAYLNNSCITYDKKLKGNRPYINIDFNPDTNFCFTFPGHFSIDPQVCLIDYLPDAENIQEFYNTRKLDWSRLGEFGNAIFLPSDNVLGSELNARTDLRNFRDTSVAAGTRGKIMNILVNIDYILLTLENLHSQSKNSSVILTDFLSNLMQGIQSALGNANQFAINYDDDSNCLRIFDSQLVATNDAVRGYQDFPMFGLNSVVHNITLQTNTNSSIGNALAISAMAGARNPIPANRDMSAFTALNSRIADRLLPQTDQSPSDTKDATTTSNGDNLLRLASLFNEHMISLYSRKEYEPQSTANIKNFYIETVNALKSTVIKSANGVNIVQPNSVTARGILPLKLTMTVDGIGYLKLWEAFLLPANRLPAEYVINGQAAIGFVVNKITHKINAQTQRWVSDIEALMINIPDDAIKFKVAKGAGKTSRRAGGITGPAVGYDGPAVPPESVSTWGFGLPLSYPFVVNSFINRSISKTRGATTAFRTKHEGLDMVYPGKPGTDEAYAKYGGSIKGTNGLPIYCIADGEVIKAGAWDPGGYGSGVQVKHTIKGRTFISGYYHMPPRSITLKAGDKVTKGQIIGVMGSEGDSTGIHLHFELWEGGYKGKLLDPVDYLPFFQEDGGIVKGPVWNGGQIIGGATPIAAKPSAEEEVLVAQIIKELKASIGSFTDDEVQFLQAVQKITSKSVYVAVQAKFNIGKNMRNNFNEKAGLTGSDRPVIEGVLRHISNIPGVSIKADPDLNYYNVLYKLNYD